MGGHPSLTSTSVQETGRPPLPTGWRRLAFRLPIWLYRAHLGWLAGSRFVLIHHVGRVSGKQREVVVEVVEHDTRSWTVVSGFGPQAQWYRNLLETPDVSIQVGRRRHDVHAVFLDAEAGGELMARYAPRHPRVARMLARFMGFAVDGSEADYREVGRSIPFVRLVER